MENATRALEIAGGVLIALLVLGLAIFGWNNLSSYKSKEERLKEIEQTSDFNAKFEAYATDLYGSELISLTNLIEDYNLNQASEENGYAEINFRVTMKDGTKYTSAKALNTKYNSLIVNVKPYKTKKIEEWGRIYQIFEKKTFMDSIKHLSAAEQDNYKVQYIKDNTGITNFTVTDLNEIANLIETYKSGLQEQEEFAQKLFKGSFEYDKNTGRLTKMFYTEK